MVRETAPEGLKTVLAAALEVQAFLVSRGRRFCLIGGLALQRWGEQRVTRDVDVTLLCPFGEEAAAADFLLSEFAARIEGARELALQRRVLLLRSRGGVGIDVALGGLPFEERCVSRASDWTLSPEATLRTCSAEDLVVLKAFAGRAQDWLDVEKVLVRQRRKLDWNLVYAELDPLVALREMPESLERLRQLRASVEKGS